MKRTVNVIGIVDCDPSKPFELELQEPGIIRQVIFQAKPTVSKIVGATSIDQAKQNLVELIPTLFVESDPDAKKKKRTFFLMSGGATVVSPNTVEYRGALIHPEGQVFFLFEEIIP